MKSKLTLAIAALMLLPSLAQAQNLACQTVRINSSGTAGADITVDGTAGGVTVMPRLQARCGAIIFNSGSAPMRCAPSTGPWALTVSGTVGTLINNGSALVLGNEGQDLWKCIRTAGSTTANVTEAVPYGGLP